MLSIRYIRDLNPQETPSILKSERQEFNFYMVNLSLFLSCFYSHPIYKLEQGIDAGKYWLQIIIR